MEILNVIDDHSRLFLASEAYPTVKAQDVVDIFHKAAELHGLPASLAHRQRRRVHRHTTQGQGAPTNRTRAPRDHQQELPALPPPNLRKDRATTPNTQALPRPPTTPQRRSQSYKPSSTRSSTTTTTSAPTEPSTAAHPYRPTTHRIKARPATGSLPTTHFRVRQDKVDQRRRVTLRHNSRLHHIGIGRAHTEPPHQAPHRRPKHPHHRPTNRPTHPRTHPRPHPRLPTHQQP